MRKVSEIIQALAGVAIIFGLIGGLHFKSRAIDAMHDAKCRVDCVAFGALSAKPVNIPRRIAWAYRLCEVAVWGGGGILILPAIRRMRRK